MQIDKWVGVKTSGSTSFFKPGFSKTESRLFLIGLLIKILVGSVLASAFMTDLFLPFITEFVENPTQSPYGTFIENGRNNAFPYPGVILLLLSIPMWPVTALAPEVLVANLIAVRLVLLIADISIYFTLRGWLASSMRERLTLLYWLNPVTFYISYVHGQLDVVPIALLVASMALLFSRKLSWSAMVFGLALGAKTSVLLIAPVYFLYFIQGKQTLISSIQFLGIAAAVLAAVNLPFLFDPGFWEMVFRNEEQTKVLTLSVQMQDVSVYWIIVALMAISALGLKIGITNPNLFIIFAGFYFSAVLVLIPPMYGWYFWIIPFFSYFFARETGSSPYLFLSMLGLYFVYFLVSPESDYLQVFQVFVSPRPELGQVYNLLSEFGLNVDLFRNIIFTSLQTSLLLLCVQVLRAGLLRYRLERISGKPFLLGIGGNSGVGKTTLTKSVEAMFGKENTTVLRGDDHHKWQRGSEEWKQYTHLNPKANLLYQEIDILRALKRGKKVWRRLYDHGTGTFTESFPVIPRRMMVFEGLHPFYLGDQRKLFDLRVFIEPDQQLANHWKICRDRKKRNYTVDQAISQIQSREQDSETFIASQKTFSDLVITPKASSDIQPLGDANIELDIEYKITLLNSFNIDQELALLDRIHRVTIKHLYEDVKHQSVTLRGNLDVKDSQLLLDSLSNRLREVEVQSANLPLGLYGAVVFLVCSVILREGRNV